MGNVASRVYLETTDVQSSASHLQPWSLRARMETLCRSKTIEACLRYKHIMSVIIDISLYTMYFKIWLNSLKAENEAYRGHIEGIIQLYLFKA